MLRQWEQLSSICLPDTRAMRKPWNRLLDLEDDAVQKAAWDHSPRTFHRQSQQAAR